MTTRPTTPLDESQAAIDSVYCDLENAVLNCTDAQTAINWADERLWKNIHAGRPMQMGEMERLALLLGAASNHLNNLDDTHSAFDKTLAPVWAKHVKPVRLECC